MQPESRGGSSRRLGPRLAGVALTPVRDPTSRLLRRLLSGSEDGAPAWVRELQEPGDDGWYGPGSAVWQVHGSLASLVGGVRALLLQACHPLALAGVEDHSDYREAPLARLQRTSRFVTTTTFGTTAQADAAAARVRRVHTVVTGTAPDGRHYDASDPHLLTWVHVALVDSMLAASAAYDPGPVDADRYVREVGRMATSLGAVEVPVGAAGLREQLQRFRPELTAAPTTHEVARFLQAPPLPRGVGPVYTIIARAAIDLLPGWAHPILGTTPTSGLGRMAERGAATAVLGGLRAALGQQSAAHAAAVERTRRSAA
jgi:uncharacterized protein (DUF2236 family)